MDENQTPKKIVEIREGNHEVHFQNGLISITVNAETPYAIQIRGVCTVMRALINKVEPMLKKCA